MPLDTPNSRISYKAEEKELYEVGEVPPLGYVPKNMYAWAIRRDRHGEQRLPGDLREKYKTNLPPTVLGRLHTRTEAENYGS